MRILELLEVSTIGTTGSTTAEPGTVSQVSQPQPPQDQQKSAEQNKQQPSPLDNILKQNQINVNSVDDFLSAYTAMQQDQQLTPDQQKTMMDFSKAMISKPSLGNQVSTLIKSLQTK